MDHPPFKVRRVEVGSERPYYLVWPPDGRVPVKLQNTKRAQEFLEKEGLSGVVNLDSFNFKKTEVKSSVQESTSGAVGGGPLSAVFDEDDDMEVEVPDGEGQGANGLPAAARPKFNLENILKSNVDFDHQKAVAETADLLEKLRFENDLPEIEEAQIRGLKLQVARAPTLEAMVGVLGSCDKAVQEMSKVVEARCLEEMMGLGSVDGPQPLKDWPVDLSKNWYCEVIRYASEHSPVILSLLLKLMCKDPSTSVRPTHVFSLASIYAQIAREVEKSNNALTMIQALSLKMDGLSDKGLDGQFRINLSATSRALRLKRDELAEIQANMLIEESKVAPSQITIDNCNTRRTNCMVAYRQAESVDTSHLSTVGLSWEETSRLFDPAIFMLKSAELQGEFHHLQTVLMLAVGRELATLLPEQLGHWLRVLPEHHQHPQSNLPLEKAQITLLPPMYYEVSFS